MATILITGFGPFPGAPSNPSGEIVHRVVRLRRPGFARHKLVGHVFATSYDAVDRDLPALLRQHRPHAVVMFGLAARTPYLRIETLARNRVSQLYPDAAGHTPPAVIAKGQPTQRGGVAPFVQLARAGRLAGVPARLSRNAGSYVCNFVYWRALEAAARPQGPRLVVFVHVPKLRGRAPTSRSRPTLDQLARAAEAIVAACLAVSGTH